MPQIHPEYDWLELARLALISRTLDNLEENHLGPGDLITYQFSAKGHELGQLLLSQHFGRRLDAASVYYRSRPFMLGLGLDVEIALASGMAREGGLTQGRDAGIVYNKPGMGRGTILPMAGDVGSQYTPAAGWAQAISYRTGQLNEGDTEGSMVMVFGGDGSVASNGFWSSLTMATTLKLPMLFVIEDNGFAISVRRELQTPGGDISANLASFNNLVVWSGSGTDPEEAAALTSEAVSYVRNGQGPGLLRLVVPRLSGHSSADNQAYKSLETQRSEEESDPLPALFNYLVPKVLSEAEWDGLVKDVETEVEIASERAQSRPRPNPREVTRFAFSEPGQVQLVGGLAAESVLLPEGEDVPRPANPRRINMVDAIRQTLDLELSINPRCLIFGEDVALKGGVHTATLGLAAKYGERRVFDTSLSEEGIIGRAAGLALAGLMPVPEIQFRKYADPATEQLNNTGTIRWRTANRYAAPMVVRMAGGFGRKIGDPWHSVTGEVVFAHAVGWRLAVPSNAEDAVGLLRAALRGNDPVIFFEHRALLDAAWARRPYPGDKYILPFGHAKIISTGDDMTVVTWGAMVERCQDAANRIGASIEIVDLRTLVPWDIETVYHSVRKTSKCLIVHEDIAFAGFGAEIAAAVGEEMFLELDGPVRRLGAPAVPVPYDVGLKDAVVPTTALIQQTMSELLAF